MTLRRFNVLLIVLLILSSTIFLCNAQDENDQFIIPKTNSSATVVQTVAATKIKIQYNRPNKKGRVIFGDLIPYGKIWRTGSDESTKLYFSTPVLLNGHPVDSGQYELFTIPGEESWEIILQENTTQWGSYAYNPANDVIRIVSNPVVTQCTVETFTISLDQIKSNSAVLNISWDNISVPIEIRVDLKATVIPLLEKLLQGEGRPPYFHAAMFYYENDIDINRAAELMSLALKQNPDHIGMLYRQALILKQKGDIKGATIVAEKSLEGAQNMSPELKAEYTRLNTALLKELTPKKE